MSKTHSKWTRVLVGGANLSGDSRSLGSIGTQYDTVEVHGFDAALKERLVGQDDAMFGPYQALFNDRPAAIGPVQPGSHIVLSTSDNMGVSAFFGLGAAPAIGNPAYSKTANKTSYTVSATNADAVVINADFTTRGGPIDNAGWGRALAVGVSLSDTDELDSVDNGAATTGGAGVYLHVTQSAGVMAANDWEITIEDSADDTTFATIATLSADGSVATSERALIAGTIRRYVRAVATKTDGTDIIFWINLIRG